MSDRFGAVINGMSATRRVTPARVTAIIRGAIEQTPDVDVWAIVEAAKVDVQTVVTDLLPGATVIQYGALGSPASALALVVRAGVPTTDQGLRQATKAQNRPGRRLDIRARPILLAQVDGHPLAVIHAPPGRMLNLLKRYLRRARRVTTGRTVMGDWNRRRSALKRVFPAAQIVSEGTRPRDVLHVVARHPRSATHVRVIGGADLPGHPDHGVVVAHLRTHR